MERQLGNLVSHHAACTYSAAWLESSFTRRRFLQVVAGGFTAATLVPWHALAASGKYEAMVLACQLHQIDKVIVINHRDCGAAKIAYGEAAYAAATLDMEDATIPEVCPWTDAQGLDADLWPGA